MERRLFLGPIASVPARAGQALVAVFAALVSLTALGEAVGVIDVPLALQLGVGARMPQLFELHMAAGGAALGLILVALALRRAPRWHRIAGRVAAACVFLAGLSAIPVGVASSAPIVARVSFVIQGALWLVLLGIGLVAIRRGDRARHRVAMSLMAAAAFGAVLLRVLLSAHATFFPIADFETAYAAIAWASWTLPFAGTALYLRGRLHVGR